MSDLSNTVLVTHKDCLDGAGCAIAFMHAGGSYENVRFVRAGTANRFVDHDESISKDSGLIFADVYVDDEHADALEKRGNVEVMDHHATAQHLSRRRWCTIDMARCGTELLAEKLDVYNIGDLAKIVSDYDLGVFSDPRSDDMTMLMNFLGQEEFVRRMVAGLSARTNGDFWTEWERRVIDVLRHNRDRIVDHAVAIMEFKEMATPGGPSVRIGYIVSSNPNVSYMLARALDEDKAIDVAAKVDIDRSIVSLRSRPGGPDVSAIAKMWGGGGHKNAAGYRLSPYFLSEIVDLVHDV